MALGAHEQFGCELVDALGKLGSGLHVKFFLLLVVRKLSSDVLLLLFTLLLIVSIVLEPLIAELVLDGYDAKVVENHVFNLSCHFDLSALCFLHGLHVADIVFVQ